ncbi:MAG: hypothetical protein AAF696_12400 [Bacteroidota bacterium]
MFRTIKEELRQKKGSKYKIFLKDQPISYQDFIHLLGDSHEFRTYYSQLLAQSELSAFFWEHKAMSLRSLHTTYEFVLIDSPALAKVEANPAAFLEKFSPGQPIASFKNLGGDAALVVPSSLDTFKAYPHLASFVREAPKNQQDEFWIEVAKTYVAELGDQPKWLSTSGLGVYCLHVRIDSRPKYYSYAAYRQFP